MCELLGVSSKTPVDVHGYLKAFYRHSVRHPHGWGLMRKSADGKIDIIREPVRATGSRIIENTIKKTVPQTDMLAHIRLATVGGTKLDNCHPYSGADAEGRRWTLIHNGTIYSGTQLSKYLSRQKGDTDSERLFLYLIDEVNKVIEASAAPLSADARCGIISRFAAAMAPRNKLNFMVYDGELLYVHKNMRDTLSYKELDNGYIFSTEPLDDGDWQPLPMTRVIAYKNGEKVFTGEEHGGEFIPTLEYITAMDAMNI